MPVFEVGRARGVGARNPSRAGADYAAHIETTDADGDGVTDAAVSADRESAYVRTGVTYSKEGGIVVHDNDAVPPAVIAMGIAAAAIITAAVVRKKRRNRRRRAN